MIDILKSPYPCSFSKNTIEFQLSSDQQYPEDIILPYLKIRVLAVPPNGTIVGWSFTNPITLELVEISITVTSATYLPNQLSSLWVGTYTQYAAYMVEKLSQMKELNGFYTITSEGPYVYITANEPLEELVPVNWSDNQLVTTYLEPTTYSTYLSPDERQGYTMQALVYFEKEYLSNQFEVVTTLRIFTAENGIAKIDLSNILDSEIESSMDHMPIPHFTNTEKIGLLRRYYVEFVEFWNDAIDKIERKTKIYHVWHGGYSTDDEMMSDPMALFQAKKQFLTWWPDRKELLPKQPDWLGFMNTTQITSTFTARVKLVTNTGSVEYTLGVIELKPWESLIIPVGYEQRIEGLIPTGQFLNYWEISVKRGDTLVMGPKRYYLNTLQGCTYNHILFYNSFGCPETVGTTEWEESMNVSANLVNQTDLMNQNRLKGGIFVFDSEHNNTFVSRTVTLTKQEGVKLQAMINSLACYVWRFNRWVPAVVQTEQSKVLLESAFTTDLSLEFMIASINDRASFAETTPKLIITESAGITTFALDKNGLDIEDPGILKIYKDEVVVYSPVWNPFLSIWEMTPPITTEGEYLARVECYGPNNETYPVQLAFRYEPKYIEVFCTSTLLQVEIQSNNPSEVLQIEYGFGNAWQSIPYTSSITSINQYLPIGKKLIRIRKPSFQDVKLLTITQTDFAEWNWQLFRNIETIAVDEAAFTGIVYLNKLPKLKTVNLSNMGLVTGAEFGVSPDLTSVTFSALGLDQEGVEKIIDNLWSFRDEFLNPVSVYFVGMPITFSSKTTAQLDGTGAYAGDGLNVDYGWNVQII